MSNTRQFTDSIGDNLQTLQSLLETLPHSKRETAKAAALQIEQAIKRIQRNFPRDGGAALGTAYAVYTIGQKLVEASQSGDKPLIQLLS